MKHDQLGEAIANSLLAGAPPMGKDEKSIKKRRNFYEKTKKKCRKIV